MPPEMAMASASSLDPLMGHNASVTEPTIGIIDFDFLVFIIGFLSLCSVFEKSRTDKKSILTRKWFFYYDLLQVALNATVAFRIWNVFSQSGDLGGFATRNTDAVKSAIQLHYYTKWLDVGFTGLLIISRRWRKINVLHIFHHATIGPVWWYVLRQSEQLDLAAYAFGGMVNSFVHMLVFAHLAIAASEHVSLSQNASLKRITSGLVKLLQIAQCVVCIAHAVYALTWVSGDKIPRELCCLQLCYVFGSLVLFSRDILPNWTSYGRTVHKSQQDSASKGVLRKESQKKSYRGFRLEKLHIKIRGVEYDCTAFQERHPGGDIMSRYHEADATDAYESFHFDSEHSDRVLLRIPKVKNDNKEENDAASAKEKKNLAALGEAEGMAHTGFSQAIRDKYFGKAIYQVGFAIWAASTIGLIWLAMYLARDQQRPVLGGCVLGLAWAHCGFLQHHCGHVAVSGKRSIDFLLQTFFEGFLKGGSARWWRNRHNKHHAQPNRIGVDGDLATTPLFAWDQKLAKKCFSWSLAIQQYTFLPFLAAYVPVFFYTTKRFMWRKGYYDELGVMLLHWYVVGCYFNLTGMWGDVSYWRQWFVLYSVGYSFQGVYLGFFFGLNHYAEARMEGNNTSWPRWQTTTAVNWGIPNKDKNGKVTTLQHCQGWFWAVASGFLNLQVEHHFFPQMPPFAYVFAQPEVERFCKGHDMPYRNLSFLGACGKMFGGLRDTGIEALAARKAKKNE